MKRFELNIPPCNLCPSWTGCKLYDKYRNCLTQYLTEYLSNLKPSRKLINAEENLLEQIVECYNSRTSNPRWNIKIKCAK